MESSSKVKPTQAVAPLLIGDENCRAAVGRSWRWCLDTARVLDVPVLTVRRRPVIPAAQFVEALMAAGVEAEPPEPAKARPAGDVESPDDVWRLLEAG